MKKSLVLNISVFLFCFVITAQKSELINFIPDSLAQYSYSDLQNKFDENELKDLQKAKLYARAYFLKSKKSSNIIEKGHGYRIMSYISGKDNAIAYADSIIVLTKNSKDKYFPTVGYLLKGYYYYQNGDYKEALDNYLKAYPFAIKKKNFEDEIHVQNMIANLKDRWGSYDESLLLYKNILTEIKKEENYLKKHEEDYFWGLFNLSLSYLRNNKPDSALIHIKKGINQSLKLKNKSKYNLLVFASGLANYEKGNYNKSLDSLSNSILHIDKLNIAIGHYYRGKIYSHQKDYKKSLKELKKMDSIYQLTNNEFPQLIDGYQVLLTHYKKNKNFEKQLEFIDKIVHVDSLIKQNYVSINKSITKKYDIPLLIKEKENLIEKLEDKLLTDKEKYSFYLYLLILFIIALFYFCFYLIRKNLTNKKRFKELMEEKSRIPEVIEKKPTDKTSTELNISDKIITSILEKIDLFEQKEGFLKKDLSINNLAKKFKTNEKYLSKIINFYKEKKFIHYINDLRIDYVVNQLKSNKKLRLYTIKAIASESGFNTSQSFSNAFQKRAGIKPSYFIDKLERSDF